MVRGDNMETFSILLTLIAAATATVSELWLLFHKHVTPKQFKRVSDILIICIILMMCSGVLHIIITDINDVVYCPECGAEIRSV
jgi:ACR3 family arsenite efflux pump ArsB